MTRRRRNPLPAGVAEDTWPPADRYGEEFVKYLVSLASHFHTLRHEPVDEDVVIEECVRLMVAIDQIYVRGMDQLGFSEHEAETTNVEYLDSFRNAVNDLASHGTGGLEGVLQSVEGEVQELIYRMMYVAATRPLFRHQSWAQGRAVTGVTSAQAYLDGVSVDLSRTRIRPGGRGAGFEGVTVRIDTEDYEDEHPSDHLGPTDLRVVLNDDYDDPLWER